MTVNKLSLPAKENAVQQKINEIIDNLDDGTVDQTYDPTSANAQSGIAISGAGFLTSSSISNLANKSVETIQNITTLSSGAITLSATSSIYKITPSANTTFSFTLASGTITANQSYTFELHINMSTVYSITLPASVTWQDATLPDLSATGYYMLVFRTIDDGTTWYGNLQGKW
jgi:hypothetical protein